MDLLTCAKSIHDYLNKKNIDFSICKNFLMKYNVKDYSEYSSDGQNLYQFTLELKSKLNMKVTLTNEDLHIDNLLSFYNKCITLLERKKKLEKLIKK